MTDSTDRTMATLRTYYDVLRDGTTSFDENALRGVLAPDLDFEGPIGGHHVGADGFVMGVRGFVETMSGMTMLAQLHTDGAASALYDAELPGGPVRFAEFFEIFDGRIQRLRLLYDAHDYQARGGR